MVEVTVRENETLDHALKRFRRQIRKEGLMEQIRGNLCYDKPSCKRRRKQYNARRHAKDEQDEKAHEPAESLPKLCENDFDIFRVW